MDDKIPENTNARRKLFAKAGGDKGQSKAEIKEAWKEFNKSPEGKSDAAKSLKERLEMANPQNVGSEAKSPSTTPATKGDEPSRGL